MKRTYQVVTKPSTLSSRALAEFLSKDGQLLLPLVELVERGEKAIDEVIDVLGRAAVEVVLRMSAEQLAGPKRQGRRVADRAVYWHGSQHGRVTLSERQLRVEKPRLRKKTARQGERGEVPIPAYDAMQHDQRLADRMLAIMLNGVSTRRYAKVLPAMAEQVGISKSEVSRETIAAGTRVLQDLAERDFSEVDMVIIYLDGIQFGHYHVLAAVGVDDAGRKHVLGVRSGASENATVTTALLEDLVARGIHPDRRRLFVVDGAKALRNAIAQVFGAGNEVQRCRNHIAGRDPRFQRGERSPLGHVPMRPIAWGQAWRGNRPRRSRPDTLASVPSPEARAKPRAATKVNAFGAVKASRTAIAGRVREWGGRVACVSTKTTATVETWGGEAVATLGV